MSQKPADNYPLLSLPEYSAPYNLPEFSSKHYHTNDIVIGLHPAGIEFYSTLPSEVITFSIGPPAKVASAFNSDVIVTECLMPNSIGFGPKGTQAYSVSLEKSPVKQTLSFNYPSEWRQQVEDEIPDYHPSNLRNVHNLAPTRSSAALIQQTTAFLNNGFWGGKLVAESLAILSIAQVLEALNKSAASSNLPKLSHRALTNTLAFIEESLDRSIGLKDLAQEAAMSLYHFARCFKNTTGLTPSAYVTERRVTRAKIMLEKSNASLIDITVACGFSSQSHLSKIIKCQTGMTPLHYRKAAQGV